MRSASESQEVSGAIWPFLFAILYLEPRITSALSLVPSPPLVHVQLSPGTQREGSEKAGEQRRKEKGEMKDRKMEREMGSQHTNISDSRLPQGAGNPRNSLSSFSTPTYLLFHIAASASKGHLHSKEWKAFGLLRVLSCISSVSPLLLCSVCSCGRRRPERRRVAALPG